MSVDPDMDRKNSRSTKEIVKLVLFSLLTAFLLIFGNTSHKHHWANVFAVPLVVYLAIKLFGLVAWPKGMHKSEFHGKCFVWVFVAFFAAIIIAGIITSPSNHSSLASTLFWIFWPFYSIVAIVIWRVWHELHHRP